MSDSVVICDSGDIDALINTTDCKSFKSSLENFCARMEFNQRQHELAINTNTQSISEISELVSGISLKLTRLMNVTTKNKQSDSQFGDFDVNKRFNDRIIGESDSNLGHSLMLQSCFSKFKDSMNRLNELKQSDSVKQYYDEFVSIVNEMRLSNDYVIACFVNGLEEEIQVMVRMYKPQTLHNAYCLAKVHELTFRKQQPKSQSEFDRIKVICENEVEVIEEVVAHKVFDEMPNKTLDGDSIVKVRVEEFDFNSSNSWAYKDFTKVKEADDSKNIAKLNSEMELKDLTKQNGEVTQGVNVLDESYLDALAMEKDYQTRDVTRYHGRNIIQIMWDTSLMKHKKTRQPSVDFHVVENFEWKSGLNYVLQEKGRKNHYQFKEATDLGELVITDRNEMKENGTKNIFGPTGDINVVGTVEMVSSYSANGLHDSLLAHYNLFPKRGNFNSIFHKQDLHSFVKNLELLVDIQYDFRGRIVGLYVWRIISEPTDVAHSYSTNVKEGIVAVFDLGGGCFDVSILDTPSDLAQVLTQVFQRLKSNWSQLHHLGNCKFDSHSIKNVWKLYGVATYFFEALLIKNKNEIVKRWLVKWKLKDANNDPWGQGSLKGGVLIHI